MMGREGMRHMKGKCERRTETDAKKKKRYFFIHPSYFVIGTLSENRSIERGVELRIGVKGKGND